MCFWAKIHSFLYLLKLPQKKFLFLGNQYRRCLSTTHTYPSIFFSTSKPACLWAHSSLSYPSTLPISKPPVQSPSPQFYYSWCWMMFILLSSSHLCFQVLSQIFSRVFPKITYNISSEYVVTSRCLRYLVVRVADTEPSVHVYWRDTASQTSLQLPQKDGSISELLHIITDGTRYTEHTVDVHSNRT
jgi:hypothetical protein